MIIHFLHHLHYTLNSEITELFIANMLRSFGTATVSLFVPIYLYVVFQERITPVLTVFLFFHLGVVFMSPLAAKLNARIGIKHTMLLSVPFLILYLFSLIQLEQSLWFLLPLVVGYALAVPFYWTALHTDFARFSSDRNRGMHIGGFRALSILASLLGPLFGGLVVAEFGFPILFLVAILIEILALFPLLLTPDMHDPYELRMLQEFRSVFRKKRWRDILAFVGEGFEMKTGVYLWPIFLFTSLSGVVIIGGITTAALVVAMLVGLLIGRFIDLHGRRSVLRFGALLTTVAWTSRALVTTAMSIFFVDSFMKMVTNIYQVPYLALVYDRARSYKKNLEHYIVIRAIAHNIGAVLMLLIGILYFNSSLFLRPFFLIAALAPLLLLFYAYGTRT